MASYNESDIQQALAQGLISEDDASYLMDALGTQPSAGGAAMGALGGGLASAALGSAGGRFLGKGADALSEMAGLRGMDKAASGLADAAGFMGKPGMQTKIPGTEMGLAPNRGALGGAGALGAAGMLGGGMGGAYAMGEPGEGVKGEARWAEDANTGKPFGPMVMERDMMLRILIDPNAPPEAKKKVLAALQRGDEAMAAAQEGQEGGMDWQSMLGGGLGAGAAGAAGLLGGQALGKMMQNAAGNPGFLGKAAGMASQEIPLPRMMQTENMQALQPAGVLGGAGLGAAGAMGGVAGADALQARFSDPFAEAGQM